jgi:putative phage-type endonuclease
MFPQDSPEWHAQRAQGIGGSDIAAVMGLSPWTSRFSLWHEKKGLTEPAPLTGAMEWGHRLEPAVAQKFADAHPEVGVRVAHSYQSVNRPWQLANPDRLLASKRGRSLLEVKTVHLYSAHAWGPDGTDEIPVHYRCQVLWYLDVLGFDVGYVAVLIGGNDYREYKIVYNEAEVLAMRAEAQEFMASLDADERPDIDTSTATYQTIRELNPEIDGFDVEVPPDAADMYVELCRAERELKRNKQGVTSVILDAMGTAKYACVDGERVAMRAAVRDQKPHLRPLPGGRAA